MMYWLYTNIGGYTNKLEEIELYINSEQPDIFILVETWLNDKFDEDMVGINGYEIFLRKDRSKRRGGGLLGYCRIGANLTIIPCNNSKVQEVESGWTVVSFLNYKIIMGIFYRPPNSNGKYDSEIIDILEEGLKIYKDNHFDDIVILGDFNLPMIDWADGSDNFQTNSFRR